MRDFFLYLHDMPQQSVEDLWTKTKKKKKHFAVQKERENRNKGGSVEQLILHLQCRKLELKLAQKAPALAGHMGCNKTISRALQH